MDVLLRASHVLKPYSEDSFLLAVSGGADSMALLTVFQHMKKNFNFSFSVAHIHHGLGGNEKYRDEALQFVQAHCEIHDIPFCFAKNERGGLDSEKDLRDFRYEKLEELRISMASRWVVTAHHSQDLLETRLMRLMRGTGPQGLEAMVLEKDFLLRPLLHFSSKELKELLKIKNVSWVEDVSNQDLGPFRNWLRHHWLPQLEKKRPGSIESLARSLDLMRESHSESFSCIQGDEIVLPEFLSLTFEDKRRALAFYMKSRGLKNYGQSHINEVLKRLDSERKDLTFQMLHHEWRVNAGRMKVLGLG